MGYVSDLIPPFPSGERRFRGFFQPPNLCQGYGYFSLLLVFLVLGPTVAAALTTWKPSCFSSWWLPPFSRLNAHGADIGPSNTSTIPSSIRVRMIFRGASTARPSGTSTNVSPDCRCRFVAVSVLFRTSACGASARPPPSSHPTFVCVSAAAAAAFAKHQDCTRLLPSEVKLHASQEAILEGRSVNNLLRCLHGSMLVLTTTMQQQLSRRPGQLVGRKSAFTRALS